MLGLHAKWRSTFIESWPDEVIALGLDQYGQSGVRYVNGKPDFSPFIKKGTDGQPIQTRISNMKGDLARGSNGDVGQAVAPLKEKYGSWGKTTDEKGFTWHHNEDTSTMQLVDTRIHSTAQGGGAHSGGASAVNGPAY